MGNELQGTEAFEREVMEQLGPRMVKDREFAKEIWGALVNTTWRKISKPELQTLFTFRSAGFTIANVRNKARGYPDSYYDFAHNPICVCGVERSRHQPLSVTTADALKQWDLQNNNIDEEFACFPVDGKRDWQSELRNAKMPASKAEERPPAAEVRVETLTAQSQIFFGQAKDAKDALGRCTRFVSIHKGVPKSELPESYLDYYCCFGYGVVTERVFKAFTELGWELDPTESCNIEQLKSHGLPYQPKKVR